MSTNVRNVWTNSRFVTKTCPSAVDILSVLSYIAVKFWKEGSTMNKTYFASYYYYFTAVVL